MSGTTDLETGPRLYWDTNVFIEAFEGSEERRRKLTELLLAGWKSTRPYFVTSELTLTELLVKPIELKRHDLIELYENWTLPNRHMDIIPVERSILRNAALLRALNKSLKLPDAIHLVTAKASGCTHFLTRDERLRGNYGIEIMPLTDQTLDELNKRIPFAPI